MCGILAEWLRDPTRADVALSRRRLASMAHRGPDGHGLVAWSARRGFFDGFTDGGHASVILGHRRLAIIDLSDAAGQPMFSEDGRFALIYNGEIYNYIELRDRLIQSHNASFRSGSDTEVLLKAWQLLGPACLRELDGMFAFVLFDSVQRKLFCVRDFFGIKPLYWRTDENGVVFASEIRALLLGVKHPKLRTPALFSYLRWGAVDSDLSTLFEGIEQVGPGELVTLEVETGDVSRERYWSLESITREHNGNAKSVREEFRSIFINSVKRHLRADVPVVATLSGGIDSSAICSVLRHLKPDDQVNVYSYISDGPYSEEKWIETVALEKSLALNRIVIDERQVLRDLPALVRAQEQPFASGSIYAQYRIFEQIGGAGYKVMLDGQGADEILGGYKMFVPFRIAELIRAGRLTTAAQLFARHAQRDPGSLSLVGGRLLRLFSPSVVTSLGRRLVGRGLALEYARPGWFETHCKPAEDEVRQFRAPKTMDGALRDSLHSTILPSLLRYADHNAMAFSVENRVPFLSRPLVEFAFGIGENHLIDEEGRTKSIMREALRGILPDAIRNRHDKIGFRAADEDWLRASPEWTGRQLDDCADLPFVDGQRLGKAYQSLLDGNARPGLPLFRLIVLKEWAEAFNVRLI